MAQTTGQNAPFFVDNEVITLTTNGVWIADGTEISHEPTRKLFARSLRRDEKGYFLSVGRETKRIEVQDTAYFIHRIDGSPESGYELWVSDEKREPLQVESLSYRPGRLTCRINRNGESEEARFLHAPYFEILKHLEEDGKTYFLNIQGKKLILASSQPGRPGRPDQP